MTLFSLNVGNTGMLALRSGDALTMADTIINSNLAIP